MLGEKIGGSAVPTDKPSSVSRLVVLARPTVTGVSASALVNLM
jgi:hypothetical protein